MTKAIYVHVLKHYRDYVTKVFVRIAKNVILVVTFEAINTNALKNVVTKICAMKVLNIDPQRAAIKTKIKEVIGL